MKRGTDLELRMAASAGRAVSLESGYVPARAVSPEAEAQVDGLMTFTAGMLIFAVAVAVAVGMLLF